MDMDSNKYIRLDGFNTYFFQIYWTMFGIEVCEVVESAKISQKILKAFNLTFITLNIPKDQ
jgi:hypothetical protein